MRLAVLHLLQQQRELFAPAPRAGGLARRLVAEKRQRRVGPRRVVPRLLLTNQRRFVGGHDALVRFHVLRVVDRVPWIHFRALRTRQQPAAGVLHLPPQRGRAAARIGFQPQLVAAREGGP